jgi:tetratricopeptide (TPR) repeat protein
MRWAGGVAGLALAVGACAPTAQERVREYRDDAVVLFQRGSYAEAREMFQAALALQPGKSDLLYEIGRCYDRASRTVPAEQYYYQCLQREPNSAECRHALAALLVRTGRQAEARRMVDDWLAKQPGLAAAYAEDGYLWLQTGDLGKARQQLDLALYHDANDPRALTELAHYYEVINRPERSLVLYERLLERDPNQPEIVQRVSYLRSRGTGRPHPD